MGKDLSRPRGRPSLSDHDRKDKILKIRLKEHQFQDLQRASEKLKVSVSEFVRDLALPEARLVIGEEELFRTDSDSSGDDNRFCFVVNHASYKSLLYRCLEINRVFRAVPCLLFESSSKKDQQAYDMTRSLVEQWELPIEVSCITDIREQ